MTNLSTNLSNRAGRAARSLPWLLLPWLLLAGLTTTGCLDELGLGSRAQKDPFGAVWVGPETPVVDRAMVDRLRSAGVGELFVPLAGLGAGGGLERRPWPELPPSIQVTMVITGELTAGEGLDELGASVAAAVHQLRFDVEAEGWIPIGVHLDLASLGSFETAAAFFDGLRSDLDESLFLSLSLHRSWLDDPALAQVLDEVDFAVPFVYGQRPSEADATDAWDFPTVERRLMALEGLEVPYAVGIVGLGSATHLDKSGSVKEKSTEQTLRTFLWDTDFKLETGFSLEGSNRRSYTLAATSPTRAGGWVMRPGDQVHLVRAATSDLQELLQSLGPELYPHRLGEVYYRLPTPEEGLSLTADQIANARGPEEVSPALELGAATRRRTARGWLYRFTIENTNGEMTELSLLDNNYLEVRTTEGIFGPEVRTGDFYRFELYRAGPGGELVRDFRNATVLRLYVPMLEGQLEVVSGDIEIYRREPPPLELRAQFLLPDGRTLETGPVRWEDGEVVKPGAAETP